MLLRAVWTEANRPDPFKQAYDTGNLGRLADHLNVLIDRLNESKEKLSRLR